MRRLILATLVLGSLGLAACDPDPAADPDAGAALAPALRRALSPVTDAGDDVTTPAGNKILIIEKKGAGIGVVQGPDFACGADCTIDEYEYPPGTEVVLSAEALPSASGDQLSRFAQWGVDCTGTDPSQCRVVLEHSRKVEATFELDGRLTVNRVGAPGGLIVSRLASGADGGISCGSQCTASYGTVTHVILSSTPVFTGAGWVKLLRWGGACFGTQSECVLDIAGTHPEVNAEFGNGLGVTPQGTGVADATFTVVKRNAKGLEESSPCGADCGLYTVNQEVEVRAAVAAASDLIAWGQGCISNPTPSSCVVRMDLPHTLRPVIMRKVSITIANNEVAGSVFVTGPDGIGFSCNAITCVIPAVRYQTPLMITPAPDSGHMFLEFQGPCVSGSSATQCRVIADTAKTVQVFFDTRYVIHVAMEGDLPGGVFLRGSSPELPNDERCYTGRGCRFRYSYAQRVTVTPVWHSQAPNCYRFVGWTGACTGIGTCTLDVDRPLELTATWATKTCHHPH